MYINETIKASVSVKLPQTIKRFSISIILFLLLVSYLSFNQYTNTKAEQNQTNAIIASPKVNDIYFLDFRVLSDKLRPHEKYRIAKVVDITGDIITLVYGAYFYQYQNAAINSIQYGQLSYRDYFETKRYDLPHKTIKNMYADNAIYMAKRPVRNKLFGKVVGHEVYQAKSSHLIYGKKENSQGEAFLRELYSETNFETAFNLFQLSSNLGYSQGQVNLAEMYINGQYVKKDLNLALYWLKQASLQSYKPAILKYGIVCKQVELCNIVDFYQELTANGVNIKVRKVDFELTK